MTANEVLNNVEQMITFIEAGEVKKYKISKVYDDLGIFDWWIEYLSKSQLLDMKKFLKEAIKLGYTGYVCFKVGASGCANGMWAYKKESDTGFSPDGEFLWKSFTPDYYEWAFSDETGGINDNHKNLKTIKELEKAIGYSGDATFTISNETKIKMFEHMLNLEKLGEAKTFDFGNYAERSNGFYEALADLGLQKEYIRWSFGR